MESVLFGFFFLESLSVLVFSESVMESRKNLHLEIVGYLSLSCGVGSNAGLRAVFRFHLLSKATKKTGSGQIFTNKIFLF